MFTVMKKTFLSITILTLAWCISSCSTTSTTSSTPVGTSGVDYRKSKADVVVLSFFDMYCPLCQKEAKYVKQIHASTLQRGQGSKINFYAIGWNNTPLESEMYRKKFNVTYPVIPDKSLTIAHRFSSVKPPLLIALRKEGGQWKEFYRTKQTRGQAETIYSKITP